MPERDELDRLIDSELTRYAEPRAGLEQRILARVEAEYLPRSWFFRRGQRWALAGAAAMAIVLAIGIPLSTHHETSVNTAGVARPSRKPVYPTTTVPDTHVETPHSKRTAETAQNATRRSKSTEVSEHARQPKLDVFPAPQPLSAQEQTFVELATHLPKAERERLLSDPKGQDAPLEISSIKISPITMPDLGKD
jgi:hypothetical protein